MSVAFLQTLITVHIFLTSFGGLIAVNLLRAISQNLERAWDTLHPNTEEGAQKLLEELVRKYGSQKRIVSWLTYLVLLVGVVGIFLDLIVLLPSSAYLDTGSSEDFLFFLVAIQLCLFVLLAFQVGDVGSALAIYQEEEEELTLVDPDVVDEASQKPRQKANDTPPRRTRTSSPYRYP